MCSIYAIIYRRVENQMKWTRELEYQTTTREKGGLVETMRPLSIYICLAVFHDINLMVSTTLTKYIIEDETNSIYH